MGDFSKNYKVKMKIEELMKETGMTEKQIISSIANDYAESAKDPTEGFNNWLQKQGSKNKVTMEDIFKQGK